MKRLTALLPVLAIFGCGDLDNSPAPFPMTVDQPAEASPFVVYLPVSPSVATVGFDGVHFPPPVGYAVVPEHRTVDLHLPALPSAGLTWKAVDRGRFDDGWFYYPASRTPRPLNTPQWQVFRFQSGREGMSRLKFRFGLHSAKDAATTEYEFELHTVSSNFDVAQSSTSMESVDELAPPCDLKDCNCPKGPRSMESGSAGGPGSLGRHPWTATTVAERVR